MGHWRDLYSLQASRIPIRRCITWHDMQYHACLTNCFALVFTITNYHLHAYTLCPIGSFHILNSPFGIDYSLSIAGGLSCSSDATSIGECQLANRTTSCHYGRSIGVVCQGIGKIFETVSLLLSVFRLVWGNQSWYVAGSACVRICAARVFIKISIQIGLLHFFLIHPSLMTNRYPGGSALKLCLVQGIK